MIRLSAICIVFSVTASATLAGGLDAPETAQPEIMARHTAVPMNWSGPYAGLSYGALSADNDSNSTSLGIYAGYGHELGQTRLILGGEAELGRIKDSDGGATFDTTGLRLRAGYNAGLVQPYAFVGTAQINDDDIDDAKITSRGIGVEFAVNHRLRLGLEYGVSTFSGSIDGSEDAPSFSRDAIFDGGSGDFSLPEGGDYSEDATVISLRASYTF
ncbi:outer membrane beta-barrel protein [Aestuariibius sp. HNIBRBA575]|uniref:outer membrane beta-barrel protein n=1 Tax=Aestuariibius sp. HNIBRBA575 TaxID=3233343 RepID=UPI0034A534C0